MTKREEEIAARVAQHRDELTALRREFHAHPEISWKESGTQEKIMTYLQALGLTAERAVIECRMPIGFEDPFCKACGAQGQARGTAPGPRTGGMETHAAAGTPAALRLHPLPPGVETGHLQLG